MWSVYFLPTFSSLLSLGLFCLWSFIQQNGHLLLVSNHFYCLDCQLSWTSSEAMNSVSESFNNMSMSSLLSLCTVSSNSNIWSVEILLPLWKYLFWFLFIFQLFTHKPLKMFVRIQKFTSSIYINTNIIQGLVNTEKPCVLFFNKAK